MDEDSERMGGAYSAAPYSREIHDERSSVRAALRTDLPAANLGLGVTALGLIVVASFAGLRWALIVLAGFTTWFILALGVIRIGGGRGWGAVRRAYIATFGWGNWI
ncbi:hypothetical protein ACIPRL_35270 [Streptomyces sp. NPDC090085]|uniref:hypothetical protein n=1 Tax=Streptomyces sp. NPDC090085 TaxID=3365943 RepID=UPI00381C6D99